MDPEVVLAMGETREAHRQMGLEQEITSIIEGKHSRASIHYSGGAYDIGLREIIEDTPEVALQKWLDQLLEKCRRALGYPDSDFDVVDERDAGGGPHFHIEYQPKRPY